MSELQREIDWYWEGERDVDFVQHLAELLMAELAFLGTRRCETCADHERVEEPCDRFSDEFLAFMKKHCEGHPVYCCFWTAGSS